MLFLVLCFLLGDEEGCSVIPHEFIQRGLVGLGLSAEGSLRG